MENETYSELVAAAEYNEARMYYNCDVHGQAEPDDGLVLTDEERKRQMMEKITRILSDISKRPGATPFDTYYKEVGYFMP